MARPFALWETISYDNIGNPTSYLGANLIWFGRQMQSYTKGDTSVSYTYDANGLRGSKTVNGVKSDYLYLDGKLVYEKKGDVDIYYNYDSYGNFAGMKWYDAAGTAYALYALTNAQGDVLGLYNGNGELKIAYTYDTWGKVISETDAQGNPLTGNLIEYSKLNPFRYRGYYYDSETGLYYLQSRYYNPEIGRFLNADGLLNGNGDILGYNMFAYCSNNPVMFNDPSGNGLLDILGSIISGIANQIRIKFNIKILGKKPLPYKTVTEAATASGKDLNNRTQKDNLEHGQGIIYDKYTDTYGLTNVIDGAHASVDFSGVFSSNKDNLVAIVHSHPNCNGHEGNVFSDTIRNPDGSVSGDWVVASSNRINVYLAAPEGTLYLMEWDAERYNQKPVTTDLPEDDTIYNCIR